MIFVTGHKGFVGQHLARAIGEPFMAYDPVATTAAGSISDVIERYGHQITAVFHLGAITDTMCDDDDALRKNNFELSCDIAAFCSERKIPMIYASSASVYGNGAGPLNRYAQSKLAFDAAMADLERTHPWYGLRFFNVYGPGEGHKGRQASVIWQMKHAGLRRIFCPFAQRDFVHVSDVVKVMLWFWKNLPASGIYDVGTGEPRTFMDAALISRGTDFELVHEPKELKGRYQYSTKASLGPLRAIGYDEPFLTLEQGVKDV